MSKKSVKKQKPSLKIKKNIEQNLADLDDHLYLVRDGLFKLKDTTAHIKVLAAELRLLMCAQNRGETRGFLWRMVQELNVSDKILLHVPGKLKLDHPLTRGLRFLVMQIEYGGYGDPRVPPQMYSIEDYTKTQEALYIINKPVTHENLIKMVSEQNGTAHEDEAICYELDELKKLEVGGVPPYVSVIKRDAELALQIGERVLASAEKRGFHKRQVKGNYGILSAIIRFSVNTHITNSIPLISWKSFISESEIQCFIQPVSIIFRIYSRGIIAKEITVKYPESYKYKEDLVVCIQYNSYMKKAHVIINGTRQDFGVECDAGFISASDLHLMMAPASELFSRQFSMCYERLLTPAQCLELLNTSPDLTILYESDEIGPLGG